MHLNRFMSALSVLFVLAAGVARAETIRVAIGTQDTTINCATGGVLIRELKLLERYLPHDGKYKDVNYQIEWKNFTSGAPLTSEMVAGKLDIGSMADFPGALNGATFQKAGRKSVFINVLSGSTIGSGNGIVVPKASSVQSLADLKGKTISVPFASTAHGLLLRAVKAQGWDPEKDITIVTQAPEIAGPALQANKIDAHADFVPFAELFPYRGYARKIYDGSQADAATFHGTLADAEYARKYPEIVVAFERAAIEADRLFAAEPEKYSELVAKNTGIDAEVIYLFHGPQGLQTRDLSWKPEYRQALKTAIETLRLLKRVDSDLDVNAFIDDRYVRTAFQQASLNYEAQLKNYAKQPFAEKAAKDARTGKAIEDTRRAAQIWVQGEARVRNYASPESAFLDLSGLEQSGKKIRVIYGTDRSNGLKLFASDGWYVVNGKEINAFLLKEVAEAWVRQHGGKLVDYAAARAAV